MLHRSRSLVSSGPKARNYSERSVWPCLGTEASRMGHCVLSLDRSLSSGLVAAGLWGWLRLADQRASDQ